MSSPRPSKLASVLAAGLLLLPFVSLLVAFRPVPLPDRPSGISSEGAGGGGATGGPPMGSHREKTTP
jgi:hypothetical protein